MPMSTPFSNPKSQPRRLRGLLRRVVAKPALALTDRRCRKVQFCEPFFDLCDATSYEQPERAPELTASAVALGELTGDRHLVHRGRGVEINAAIALARWDQAEELLRKHEQATAGCCEGCLADHLHRRADLALEHRQTAEALRALDEARPVLEVTGTAATVGRVVNLSATGRHLLGESGAALEEVGAALRTLPLDMPPLFFRDAIGLMACFLKGAGRRLDERALGMLLAFKGRLQGLRGWRQVRTRLRWLEGLLYARLGDNARAAARLEGARGALLAELGVPLGRARAAAEKAMPRYTDRGSREMVALTADLLLLASQRRESLPLSSKLDTCRRCLVLDRGLHQALDEASDSLRKLPAVRLEQLVGLRASVLVPFPGLLAERYVGVEQAAALARTGRPPSATPLCYSAAATAESGKNGSSSARRSDSGR